MEANRIDRSQLLPLPPLLTPKLCQYIAQYFVVCMVRYDVNDVDFYSVCFLITWMKGETVRPKKQGYTKTQSVCFHWITADTTVSPNNMSRETNDSNERFGWLPSLFNEGKYIIA